MLVWLDHKIFGNGFGIAAPYFDYRYYWLVDTEGRERSGKNGTLYTYSAGFGAQLTSFQWTHPKPGERRRLIGREFRAFSSERCWGRVRVSWSMKLPADIDAANATLRKLAADLNSTLMEPSRDV